jgi:nucleoside-diphosphate-sugar epimerase
MAAFLDEFARLLGAPPPRHVPRWLARLAAGALTVEALTTSMHTTNARFRRDTGWAPRYPTFREGLAAVLGEWAAEPRARRAA